MSLITITHRTGSQGLAIAQKVSNTLDLRLYDDDALQQVAISSGIRGKDLEGLDEKAPGFFTRLLSLSPTSGVDLLESVIYRVAQQGSGIILGHGSQILLKDFDCAFHVGIQASEAVRAQTLAHRRKLSLTAAEKLLKKMDDKQRGFFRYAFNLDWHDSSLYDLIINTGQMSADTAAALIVEAVRSGDFQTCSMNALATMENLSLERKVQAAIAKKQVDMDNLSIEVPEKGSIYITGLVKSPEDRDRIQAAIEAIAGAAKVHIDVSVFTGGHI